MDTIHDIITNPIFGVFTALLGFFFGHRFALWRDRRCEFNEVADSFFAALHQAKQNIESEGSISDDFEEIGDTKLISFTRYLPWWKRASYQRAAEKYKIACIGKDRVLGGSDYLDHASVLKAIDDLLPFTKRK